MRAYGTFVCTPICPLPLFSALMLTCQSPALAKGPDLTETFTSSKKTCRIQWDARRPDNDASPIVLFLYGSSGNTDPAFFRYCASRFATIDNRPATVTLIDYFDVAGIESASTSEMSQNFTGFRKAIADAIDHINTKYGTRHPIFIFGYSLGAELGLLQTLQDPRITAVSCMSGYLIGRPQPRSAKTRVLFLHGDKDRVVALSKMQASKKFLDSQGIKTTCKIYPGQGHCFDWVKVQDAIELTRVFFARQKPNG